MTKKKTNGTRICLGVIENYQEKQFGQLEYAHEAFDFLQTQIWKKPERLAIKSDYSLLYNFLVRAIAEENYDDPLTICRSMRSFEPVGRIFKNLLMTLLKEERYKTIDPHLILVWLETGDQLFNDQGISKKCYGILKLYYLWKVWKTKHECFTCGCIQKIIIDLFLDNNSTRFVEALLSLIKSSFSDIDPTVRRLLNSFTDIKTADLFSMYTEVLQDLYNCKVIDYSSSEKAAVCLIQLIGLLCEMEKDEVPEACSRINNLLSDMSIQETKKPLAAVEIVMKTKLLPKVLTSLSDNINVRLENFNRSEEEMYAKMIEKDSYRLAQQAEVFFAPLKLINFINEKWDVSKKSQPVVKNELACLNLKNSQAPVLLLYIIGLIYRNYSSLLSHFIEFLTEHYGKSDVAVKNKILTSVGVLKHLSTSNPSIKTYFQENRVKSQLIASTRLDSFEVIELVFQYLPDFEPNEFDDFLTSHSKGFTPESWSLLFGAIKNFDYHVKSEVVWQYSLRKSCEKDVISFIEQQLKLLIKRNDKMMLKIRVEQIFQCLRTNSSTTEQPQLLIAFSNILLLLPSSEYQQLPADTTKSLISVLILAYCFHFDRHDFTITKLFRSISQKIKEKENVQMDSREDPIVILGGEICDYLKKTELSFFGKETLFQTLFDYTMESRGSISSNIEFSLRAKERIAEVASVLFGQLAPQLQKFCGDKGKSPFCILANIIEKYIAVNPSTSSVSKRLCLRAMEGYKGMTTHWNKLFAVSRVMKMLMFSQNHPDILPQLMQIIRGNEVLLFAMRDTKKNEFTRFEKV